MHCAALRPFFGSGQSAPEFLVSRLVRGLCRMRLVCTCQQESAPAQCMRCTAASLRCVVHRAHTQNVTDQSNSDKQLLTVVTHVQSVRMCPSWGGSRGIGAACGCAWHAAADEATARKHDSCNLAACLKACNAPLMVSHDRRKSERRQRYLARREAVDLVSQPAINTPHAQHSSFFCDVLPASV